MHNNNTVDMSGWKEEKLGNVLKINYGKDHKKLLDGEIPLYGSGGIMRYVEKCLFEDESILIPRKGTLSNLFYTRGPIWVVDTIFWTKINKEIVWPRFLFYQLKTKDFTLLNVGTAVPSLTTLVLNEVDILLPPLPIQHRIAAILSAYDDLIDNNLKRIKLLEEVAQRTYEEWFVKFRINGTPLPLDATTGLPVGWERKKIGEALKTSSGGTPSRKKEDIYFNNGTIHWIKTKELNNTIIVDSEEKITELALKESSAKLFPPKTVLLAMYGNTIGETAYLSISASTNQACCAFLFNENEYLSYYTHQFLLGNKDLILGYRMGAAQENISQDIIKSIEILMPSCIILKQFGVIIEPIYDQITLLIKQNRLLKESRDILLPKLMNGSLNVASV